jgi:glycosyltransferase involved in cell wall biosynthesis
VIAISLNSCREVIEHGVTGFLVSDVCGAGRALEEVPAIADDACRSRVQERFSVATMVEGYEQVYARIFLLERDRNVKSA